MAQICPNCTHDISLNFCPNCGQKKHKRIDGKYVKDEIQYVLIHTNKGFFYTAKSILRNPGGTAKSFIEGNRVNHYKPILLVALLAGLTAFLIHAFIEPTGVYEKFLAAQKPKPPVNMLKIMEYVTKYYTFIMLLSIPAMSVFTWLVFKKWGYNYYENIIVNAFFLSLFLILDLIVIMPLQYGLSGNPSLFFSLGSAVTYLIGFGCLFWFFITLYPEKSAGPVILRTLGLLTSLVVFFVVFCIAIGIIYAAYMMANGNLQTTVK